MAYTGQACTIMRKRGMPKACTTHSGLFTPVQSVVKDEHGNIKMNKQFNVPLVKWNFVPKDFTNSGIELIILDEAWMIPKKFKKYIEIKKDKNGFEKVDLQYGLYKCKISKSDKSEKFDDFIISKY